MNAAPSNPTGYVQAMVDQRPVYDGKVKKKKRKKKKG